MDQIPKLPKNKIIFKKNDKTLILNPYSGGISVLNDFDTKVLELLSSARTLDDVVDTLSESQNISPYEISARLIEFISKLNERKMFIEYDQNSKAEPPFYGFLEITRKCDYPCKACALDAGKEIQNELSIQEIKSVIDQMVDLGVKFIALTGGDPLTKKGFLELLKYCKNKGVDCGISTSLQNLTNEMAKEFRDMGISVQVSIDGSTAEINDWNRGKGSFENAMRGVELLNEHDVPFRFAYCIMKYNVKDIPNMCDLGVKLGAKEIAFRKVKLIGRAKKISNDVYPSVNDMIWAHTVLHNKSLELYNKIRINARYNNELMHGRKNCEELLCSVGKIMMHISADGKILPCSLFPKKEFTLGDVRKNKLSDIWYNSDFLNRFRKLTVNDMGKCKECKIKYICGAGCRAEPFINTGDIKGECSDCKELTPFFNFAFDKTIDILRPINFW